MGRPSKKSTKPTLGRDEQAQKIDSQFFVCPEGHKLPHRAKSGSCTPIWCAGKAVRGDKPEKAKKAEIVKKELDALKKAVKNDGEDVEHTIQLQRAGTRRNARLKAVEFPEAPMEAAAAEEWADKKLISLLPEAVAELEFKLKFGDDDQREKAAEKIMNATGRGKRDNSGGGGNLFTVIMPASVDGAPSVPWMQRVTPPKLPEGEK